MFLAAHCFLEKNSGMKGEAENVRAVFGAHLMDDDHELGRFTLTPKEIIFHPDWSQRTAQYDADLAFLRFKKDGIHFGAFVQPIRLWDSENEPNMTDGIVIGWGSADSTIRHENEPSQVELPIFGNNECLPGHENVAKHASSRTFCAGGNEKGACFGDSGSGLFAKVNSLHYLMGIVSSSPAKDGTICDVSQYTIYTNVLKFKDWIENETRKTSTGVAVMFCSFRLHGNSYHQMKTCSVDNVIDNQDIVLGSPKNNSIERFEVSENIETKFLPKDVGEKFQNLIEFWARQCGLKIIFDFYFKNMGKLVNLNLRYNQITTIKPKAFDDLVSLRELWLNDNMIETLDENLFAKMTSLEKIGLFNNKIKFLNPETFKIPGNRRLWSVYLEGNVCISKDYNDYMAEANLNQLESDLKTLCLQ